MKITKINISNRLKIKTWLGIIVAKYIQLYHQDKYLYNWVQEYNQHEEITYVIANRFEYSRYN